MYICIECGYIFEEPYCWEETHGFEYGPYEKFSGCPKCCGAYAETFPCDICNNWIETDYVETDDGQRYCEDCFRIVKLGTE